MTEKQTDVRTIVITLPMAAAFVSAFVAILLTIAGFGVGLMSRTASNGHDVTRLEAAIMKELRDIPTRVDLRDLRVDFSEQITERDARIRDLERTVGACCSQ